MKLHDALDQILGAGRTAMLAERVGVLDALAAGLAAVEIAGSRGPAAEALAAFAERRLRIPSEPMEARHALVMDISPRRTATAAPPAGRAAPLRGTCREAMAKLVAAS